MLSPSIRSHARLAAFTLLSLSFIGCGSGNNPSSGSPNPPGGGNPPPGSGTPPQVAEYIYTGGTPYIDTFQVNTSTGIPAPPAQLMVHGAQTIVATNPARFVFASEWQSSTSINALSVGTGGALTLVNGSPFTLPAQRVNSGIADMALTPDNSTLFVLQTNPAAIVSLQIDSSTGALTRNSSSVAFIQAIDYGELAIDPTGRFLYAALGASNGSYSALAAFTIDPTTQALTEMPSSPYIQPANSQLSSIALDPTSRFLYLAQAGTGQILGYTLDATGGSLTPMSGTPLNTPSVFTSSIALNPSGTFLFALGSGEITSYLIDSKSGLPTMNIEWTTTPQTYCPIVPPIVVDPTGFYAYTGGMCVFLINQATGHLTLVTPTGINTPDGDGAPSSIAIAKAQ